MFRLRFRSARLMSTTYNTQKRAGEILLRHEEDNERFFRFTRGRFLCDEPCQLSQRYIQFNIDELANLAVRVAEAVSNRSRRCVNIEKLADGMHSKAVRFTMDDGFQAVGKVPNPNAGLPHFTTASEVATMDFMRNVLGTPAPKVFSWSSTTDNAVGAEYILMENVRGVQLSQIWDRLNVEVKLEVLKKVALYQDSWAQTRFSQYGSLYYKQDLAHSAPSVQYTDTNGQDVVDDRFAVGPSMSRQNTDDGRAELHFDRGPWHTAEDYERATGLRESYCIRNIPQLPRSPIAIYYSGTYQPSREKKLLAAESYLKLVKFLMPDDESIRMSHIWHNDLHTENIFVNPDNPSEIYGFIDWQSTELAPLYDHTLEPYFLDYDGPSLGGLLERPRLEDIRPLFQDEPEPVASRKANSLFTKMSLVALYRYFVRKKSMRLFKALEYRQTLCFHLLLFARNLLVDGEATYLELLANQQQENWVGIPKISQCNEGPPLSFSKDMLEEIEKDSTGATTSIMLMQEAQQMIGEQYFRAQGVVSHEQFAKAREIIPRVKEKFIRKYARNNKEERELDRAWPFN